MFKSLSTSFAAIMLATSGLHGQVVAALPGTSASGSTVNGYTVSSLALLNSLSAGPNSFTVLAKPDGSKYYIVANSTTKTVTEVDNNFSNPKAVASFSSPAIAAAMTPNGTRLVVAANTLQFIDTTADQPVGTGVTVGAGAYDIAISLDGSTAFVLAHAAGQGSVVAAVDIPTATLKSSISIPGTASGVAVGPNGLVYVTTINEIVEANYANFTLTQTNIIALNANPTKLTFTSDGQYAAATNETPSTGSSVQLYSLSTHTVANFVPNFGVTLDRIISAGSNEFIAYSQTAQGLYTVAITTTGNFVINPLTISGLPGNTINGFAISNEIGLNGGAVTNAHYLFVSTPTTIYKVDLDSNAVVGQVSPTFTVGAVSYAVPALVNALPATLLTYGALQSAIAPGATSLPLTVQVLDANGVPISGVAVTFSTSAGTLAATTATTGSNGFAQTALIAPAASGTVAVTASASSLLGTFKLQVSGSTGTGTGGTPTGTLAIVAGQGQILASNNDSSPVTVLVTNPDGSLAANVPVTFTIIQGQLSFCGMCGTPTSVPGQTVVMTNSMGEATVSLISGTLQNTNNGFDSNALTVSATNTNTVTIYQTTTGFIGGGGLFGEQPTVFLVNPAPLSTISGPAGSVLKGGFVFRIVSQTGVPIPNVSGALINTVNAAAPPPASCLDPTGAGVLSDSTGTITCDVMFSGQVETGGQVGGVIGSTIYTPVVFVNVTQGLPSKVTIVNGNNQTGAPGQLLPTALLVQVTDAGGNPLPGTPVSFAVSPAGGATLSNVSSATDPNSRASAQVTLGKTAGPVSVTVTAGTATATFKLTVSIPLNALSVVSGSGQTATVSTAFPAPLVVQAVDSNKNPVAGVAVAFAVTSGSASLSAATATTGTNGQASITASAGSTAGNIVVTASSSGFTAQFMLVAAAVPPPGPTITAIVNGASFQPGASPGSIVTIMGTNLANSITGIVTPNNIVEGPLPTTLGGVSVTFNGTAAPIFSVSNVSGAQQVTVQVPFELSPGQVSVVVTVSGGGSTTVPLTLTQFSPGVFFTTINNLAFAIAVRSDGSYVTPANPAHRGENIMIFLTGLGQTTPAAVTGTEGQGQPVVAPLVTGLNNGGVPLISAVLTPNLVGVYAVTLTVPANTATGPAQPLGFIIYDANNNATYAESTFIPIQ
jgi:uncharacterized protein (TIGR03437 family)